MTYVKTIVCLANSTKRDPNRCIAGRELVNNQLGSWIRPVTGDATIEGAIPPSVSRLDIGRQIAKLDIVEMTFDRASPKGCQIENHLLAPVQWRYIGAWQLASLPQLANGYPDLWNKGNSTYNGLNDQISTSEAGGLQDSLRLIEPDNFSYCVRMEGWAGKQKRALRGSFSYKGTNFTLKITDPAYAAQTPDLVVDREYTFQGRVLICVSIADVFRDNHYKLIAAIYNL